MTTYRLKMAGSRNPWRAPASSAALDAPTAKPKHIYTVGELTREIRGLLEQAFPVVWVEGEVSDPKVYPSGHLWFDLKDAHGVLKGVMWRDDARRLKFALEHGLQVVCCGRIEFYPPRGDVKFVVEAVEPKGLGALQLAFEQLCAKLEKEGLFDAARKRPLPAFPQSIGVVTSPTGAAIEDMLRILRGQARILLYPTRVQGDGAAAGIARGISILSARDDLDCLIVGRGGGSLEDLWAFNEELVARAIAASRLPVISAVGHEKDTSVADLVADVRAPTPTKGAELIVAQRRQVLDRFADAVEAAAFAEPERWLGEMRDTLAAASADLESSAYQGILRLADRVRLAQAQAQQLSPQALIERHVQRLGHLGGRLQAAVAQAIERAAARYLGATGRLQALSPLDVLARGYSITFDAAGRIVRRARQVAPGAPLHTRVHEGQIISRVERVETAPASP